MTLPRMRDSDRWVTPGVVIAALVVAGVIVLGVGAGVVYLSSIGRDPEPVLKLLAQVVTAAGALGTLLLQLAGRRTVAKVERNTGQLATELARQAPAADPYPPPPPTQAMPAGFHGARHREDTR